MLKRTALVALLMTTAPAFAGSSLAVSGAWIRHLPGDHPMAGYFVLKNDGDRNRSLVGASSPAFGNIQLHRTKKENGVASMAPVDSVPVPARGSVAFQPGGYHLMMMQPSGDLKVGDSVAVTLHLADGEQIETPFTVKPPWQE